MPGPRTGQLGLKLSDLGFGDRPQRLTLWLVRPGDKLTHGQPVAEILCGPALVDLPSPVDGRVTETLAETDSLVASGQVLAIIETADATF